MFTPAASAHAAYGVPHRVRPVRRLSVVTDEAARVQARFPDALAPVVEVDRAILVRREETRVQILPGAETAGHRAGLNHARAERHAPPPALPLVRRVAPNARRVDAPHRHDALGDADVADAQRDPLFRP
jgi:hypothetical protein